SIEQRLRLFLDVCSAVEHAHRNFVVHRDIKPGNILVDKSGVPKLLDFGICKLLYADPLMAGNTIAEGARMLTPDYASPEQFSEDIRKHLSHLPVKARPDTAVYRIRKFVRRRTGTVVASAIAIGVLLAGVVVSTYQAHLANQRFEQVRELANSIIFNISES